VRERGYRRLGRAGSWGVVILLAGLIASACAPPPPPKAPRPDAYIHKLSDTITEFWFKNVQREMEQAIERGVPVFILELDTPGGYIVSSMDLGDYIFSHSDKIKTVAFVNHQAFSGGTMVALACDSIYIKEKVGQMGDVAPVNASGEIQGEKLQTVVRNTMMNYARGRYPEALVEAMVTKELEVYALRLRPGDDKEKPAEDGAEKGEEAAPAAGEDGPAAPAAKLIYVTGEELAAMPAERRRLYGEPELVVRKDELLSLGADDAEEYGFATQVADEAELFELLDLDPERVRRIELSATSAVLKWLDLLSPLLITAGIVLLFIEVSHPGFGLPGILGIICFVAFFVIKISLNHAHAFEVILFGLGMVLLLVEVFLIPGFGVTGAAGLLLIFFSLVLAFQDFTVPTTAGQTSILMGSMVKVLGSFFAAGIIVMIVARYLPAMPFFRRVVQSYYLREARAGAPPEMAQMVGRSGVALSALRPAGRADFDGKLLDVVTDGGFIEKGMRVRILEVHGSRVVVEPRREA